MTQANHKAFASHEAIEDVWPDSDARNQISGGGLTKREYFAAIALQGLLTKYTLNKPEDQHLICKMATELSIELINALNETA